ncbi:MAG: metallophosphoesterase family protein, partial [Acidimicrobiales bacterium]
MAPTFPFTALPNAEVFSVDDRSAQLVWRSLGTGGATAHVAGRSIPLGPADRVGAAIVDELTPGSPHVIDITVDGRPAARLTATTSPSLSSAPLSRIATISDLHFGEEGFGLVKRMSEPRSTPIGHPLRCALAAVREAEAWGAQLLVVKGDITDRGHGHEWEQFDTLLSAIHVPVIAIPGNHDVKRGRRSVDATEALRARGLFPCPVHHVDVPGARIVAVDTTIRGQSRGRLEPRLVDLQAALDADRPMLVFLHHHLEVTPLPVFWPIGVPRSQGMAALERMLEVNADLLVSSGHTLRIRGRSHGTAVVT